uniref:Uncharacterized protein n=1 Tax=viral metagenome TaxID=1070528 RepID=A0A6M3KJL4_9ZZZZ
MKDNVKKEIETIKLMINNWETFYLSQAKKGEDNMYLLQDLTDLIDIQTLPYLDALYYRKYLSLEELSDIKSFVYTKIYEFHDKLIKEVFPSPIKQHIDINSLYSQFIVHRDLIDIHKKFDESEHGDFINQQKLKAYDIASLLIPELFDKFERYMDGYKAKKDIK